jgi:hypothetical protein
MSTPIHKEAERAKTYGQEDCGICHKTCATYIYFNPISRRAHKDCMDALSPCESKVNKIAKEYFKSELDFYKLNMAHVAVLEAVIQAIDKDNLKDFFDESGAEKLTELFNSVGLNALQKFFNEH